MGYRRLPFDGGTIEYVVDGPEDARDLLLFHVGTPSAAVSYPGLTRAAAAAGMRTATFSRPGYAGSTRRPGRRVASEAAIASALVDRLGYERFFTAGWSGGGPGALACAALLPERVRACLTLASIAPWAEVGDEFLAWRPSEDVAQWHTLAGDDALSLQAEYEAEAPRFAGMTKSQLARFPRSPRADRKAAHEPGGFGAPLARSMRRAMSRGVFGWLDDAVAHARDWGFRVADIRVPVVVRHGEQDPLVDVREGRWLAGAIPGARGVFLPDRGHGSIAMPFDAVVRELIEAAR